MCISGCESDEQPGKSGSAKIVHDCDIRVILEDEDDGEALFDSDSDDEWMRFAEQLSLGAADSDNAQTDSDDEQMRFAKQLSLMKMYSDICDTEFDDYVEDDNNTNDIQSGADNSQSMCEICTNTTDDMLSYGCPHYYCRSCVQTYLETDINEGKIDTFKCPAPECDVCVSENFVKTVVSATVYNKYETLMIKRAVGDMDDIVYCPFAECGAMIETDGSGLTQCWKCSHHLCTLCSKLYHGNTDCELTEDERTENLRRIRDEEVAERILLEESQNQLLMEAIERDNEEWSRRMREERAEIRRMEQIEQEEEQRRQEEAERMEQIERKLKEDRRKEMEFQRLVQENEERERRRQQILNERRQAEIASEQTVKDTTKQCPQCKSPIEKNDGCIHMTCIKCRYEFCWGCMMQWAHHHICPR